jgi:hypothetical protein
MKKEKDTREGKLRWSKPSVKYVGNVGSVLKGGGGKLSPTGGDPGENRVEKPHA